MLELLQGFRSYKAYVLRSQFLTATSMKMAVFGDLAFSILFYLILVILFYCYSLPIFILRIAVFVCFHVSRSVSSLRFTDFFLLSLAPLHCLTPLRFSPLPLVRSGLCLVPRTVMLPHFHTRLIQHLDDDDSKILWNVLFVSIYQTTWWNLLEDSHLRGFVVGTRLFGNPSRERFTHTKMATYCLLTSYANCDKIATKTPKSSPIL
jgi:hypothetical protein